MKSRLPTRSSPNHWTAAVRASAHPVLALLAVNVGLVFYAFPAHHPFLAAIFGILIPGAALVAQAQTFSTGVARSNLGVFPRAERPFGYWLHVAIWFAAYLFVSAVPYLPYWSHSSPP